MALDTNSIFRIADGGLVNNVRRGLLMYASADAVATIEADGYFDPIAHQFTEGAGDVLIVSHTTGGSVGVRVYAVTRTSGDIALTAAA